MKTLIEIEGLFLVRLLNAFFTREIAVYKVKFLNKHKLRLSVDGGNTKKAIAICRELCYNIKIIKESGILAVPAALLKRTGILIGIVIAACLIFTYNNFIFKITVCGSADLYEKLIIMKLEARGIHAFSVFSEDINLLEKKLLAEMDFLSFLSIEKRGATLIIYTVKAEQKLSFAGDKPYKNEEYNFYQKSQKKCGAGGHVLDSVFSYSWDMHSHIGFL